MGHSLVVLLALLQVACGQDIKMKGMTLTADRYCKEVHYDDDLSMRSLEHLATTGCNYVSIVVTWYQTTFDSGTVFPIYGCVVAPLFVFPSTL
jgi:hypothetical protein